MPGTDTGGADRRVTALVVDDDADFRAELVEGLERLGVRCLAAGDAAEALALAAAHPEARVVVADIGLPRIDGLELLRKLKSRQRAAPLAAIVLTGEATIERAVAALRIEATDFLRKPVDAHEVADAIEAALARQAAEASPARARPGDRLASEVALRKERKKIFGAELFEDPVWEMLLDLANADARGQEIPVTSLCLVSGVSTTTALRRLDDMAGAGLVERRRDPDDGRRVLVRLTPVGREKVARYLERVEATMG